MSDAEISDCTSEDNDQSIDDKPINIGTIIDNFLHRVLDIEDCGRNFCSLAAKQYNENSDKLRSTMSEFQDIAQNENNREEKLKGIKGISKTIRKIERHNNSSPVKTLEKGLFIYLFAAFDKYVGDLISIIYEKEPRLYKNLNREISLSNALEFDSIEELRSAILSKEIETIKRKSYIDQFKDFENKFSIKLRKFNNWPLFIECAQRRNLFTHCDGVVSKQYLEVCKSVDFNFQKTTYFEDIPEEGDTLKIGGKYFFISCHIVTEVAVMLGHTLWRKTIEKERETADSHLSGLTFDFLQMESWPKAIAFSKFAMGLPAISSEQFERIFLINLAIALKAIDDNKQVKKLLDKKDWSATTYDFQLAYAILTDNHEDACRLMTRMGKQGELISELAYHDWPLFREFRDTDGFFKAYYEIYGYQYSSKLNKLADKKKSEVEKLEPKCE